ncbi:nitroreductase family deazaflavin-dependent oxidoreductase [Microbacterium invictum]|uniref:Deazaflavin-dependent oxidoreductase (Nitroreductase family) n=1 Tax=Microbacterium invictum TaxID=515415 RepID=A0AA40SPF5_9MICO|nr:MULTISPECIES: nitroreductase family deazaflavin-dependent oxidoreductase [Microbacterium]MBB4139926.1 deazaflavin-dependent oxidoreductase (nitroreductase family) [Microbacterium invictum]
MTAPNRTARITARLLKTPWLMRMPIGLYRVGLGWLLGDRLLMIEHLGRVSHTPRYVVVEVVERSHNVIRVASGLGSGSQWYRNLRANGVAYLSIGRARRIRANVRFLSEDEAAASFARYAAAHPQAWEQLSAAMEAATGSTAPAPMVEFTPPGLR